VCVCERVCANICTHIVYTCGICLHSMFTYTHVPTSLEVLPALFGVRVAPTMFHTICAAVLAARVCIYVPYSPHVCGQSLGSMVYINKHLCQNAKFQNFAEHLNFCKVLSSEPHSEPHALAQLSPSTVASGDRTHSSSTV
jgi:hypothetical protein